MQTTRYAKDDAGNWQKVSADFERERSGIPCKVCDRGALVRKQVYRMSGPVVVIGFLLLIPSVVVIAALITGLLLGLMKATQVDGGGWLALLSTGFVLAVSVPTFIGGLLGWLLVMRKQILKCTACGAVVNAS